MNLIPAALTLLRRFWYAVPILGLFIALMITRHTLERRTDKLHATQSAFETTVLGYRAAADKAKALDLANVIRVQAERKASDQKAMEAYETRLTDSDARYSRLLARAKAYSGSPGAKDVSASVDAACRAYAGTACEAIPPLLKAAQDNTDQLIALQAAVRGQAAIP